MKSLLGVCLIVAGIIGLVATQGAAKAALEQGISVQMPVASEAVAIPAADELSATVITVTADGKLFLGTQPITADTLAGVAASTAYVKADARAPYQQVLTVLNALHGRSIVLLTASAVKTEPGRVAPPYGMKLVVGGEGPE